MTDMSWAGLALAALFAAFTGFNDAGALVGIGLRIRGLRPVTGLVLLAAAVAAAPVILGTAVAATLGRRLVAFDGADAGVAVAAGVGGAILVTAALSARGLPTSLTLALIGGIAGAGVGAQTPVNWPVIGLVLLVAAVSPVAGALAALAVTRMVGALPAPEDAGRRLRRLHAAALAATCLAYGANDGQKMLAVWAAVQSGSPDALALSPLALATVTGCFLVGGMIGLPRLAAALAGGLTSGRPDAVVVTELSGAGVVLGTAALGAPVSMTQSLSGAMVGTGLSGGARRVRWRGVVRLGRAWLLTLPTAFAVGAAGCLALEAIR
ncbi:inorganic phosphate transporter [Nonomuraea sp. MG754425]|uniref:inorganic phosphate transporter n=1 Tax=Nonomuraea sp. MG754425 TaxID=2570319 RepID=UPI001F02F935|nr:inorganic phosphate transporter [Nonomuraea sp. MG754425]